MRKIVLGLALSAALSCNAYAQSVQQSGTVTQGHPAAWVTNGVVRDGGTAASGNLTSVGITASGDGICQNSAAISSSAWQQICMGVTTLGGGYLKVQNFGTAPAQGISFIVNGSSFTFPAGLTGSIVTTSTPTTDGSIACFAGTLGVIGPCTVINSGTWQGTPIAVAFGGTGATNAGSARTNLGLGSIATQNANAVALTGGTATGFPTPTQPTDVAIKSYVDSIASGIIVIAPSKYATAAVLPGTPTYVNGTLGVGATLTNTGTNAALIVDGTAVSTNDVILVKNQASTSGCTVANVGCQNGIYAVTTVGDGSTPYVLTRATYFDQAAEMVAGSYTLIQGGATNIGAAFTLAATVTTVGTTPLNFNQFSQTTGGVSSILNGTGAITGDDSLRLTGQQLAATIQLTPQNNYIQNGAMAVSQYFGTGSIPFNGNVTQTNPYVMDRWQYDQAFLTAIGTIQQVVDAPPGYTYSTKFTITTGMSSPSSNTVLSFFQPIEGQAFAPLAFGTSAAQNLTCSWWTKASRTGQHGGVLKNFGGTRTWAFAYTVVAANTWEYHTTTITGDTVGGTGNWPVDTSRWGFLLLNILSGSGFQITPGIWTAQNAANATGSVNNAASNTDYIQFTGAACFAGNFAPASTLAAAVVRPTPQEFNIVQRYYQRWAQPALNGGNPIAGGGTCAHLRMTLPVPMRAVPNVAMDGNLPISDGPHTDTLAAITVNSSTPYTVDINATTTSGNLLPGQPCYTYMDGTTTNALELHAEP